MKINIVIECDNVGELVTHLQVIREQIKQKIKNKLRNPLDKTSTHVYKVFAYVPEEEMDIDGTETFGIYKLKIKP